MSEDREMYAVPNAPGEPGNPSQGCRPRWLDLHFDDGQHTGVRILAGTTIIEVQRKGRKKLVDVAQEGRVKNQISQSADPGAILSGSVTVSAVPEGKISKDEE